MDRGTIAIPIVVMWLTAAVVSYSVTQLFIRHHREQGEPSTLASLSNLVECFVYFPWLYVDAFVAIGIATRDPDVKIPIATVVQGILLCAMIPLFLMMVVGT